MTKLLIIGAGSFSPEVEELASLLGYTDIAFLDDNPSTVYCSPIIGTTADIPAFRSRYDTAIVALGNNETKMEYHEELKRCGYNKHDPHSSNSLCQSDSCYCSRLHHKGESRGKPRRKTRRSHNPQRWCSYRPPCGDRVWMPYPDGSCYKEQGKG